MTEKFKVDDFVWAKMKGYPQWPAKVVNPNYSVKAPKNKKCQYIYFFGTRNFSWIPENDIILHSEDVMNTFKKKKSHALQHAIDDFMNHYIDSTEEIDYFKVRENPETEHETADGKKCNVAKNKSSTSRSNASASDAKNIGSKHLVMPSQKTQKRFIKKTTCNEADKNDMNFHIPLLQHSYHKSDAGDNFSTSMSSIKPKMSSQDTMRCEKVIPKKKPVSVGLKKKKGSDSLLKLHTLDGNNIPSSDVPGIEPVTKSVGSKKKKKIVKKKKFESDDIEDINAESDEDNSKFCELQINETAVDSELSFELLSDSLIRKMENGKRSPKLGKNLSIIKKQVEKEVPLNSNNPPKRRNEEKHDTNGKTDIDVASGSSPHVPNFPDNTFTDDSNLPVSCPKSNDDAEKNIGFLGLDEVGGTIVKKFLEHKFHVTLLQKEVIDRNRYVGAKIAPSPAEMVAGCDIIFFFYTETEPCRKVIFGKAGLLKGLEEAKMSHQGPKGFVLLTPPDLSTSHQTSEAIIARGGFYLEAPICGTIDDIKVSKAVLVASGDEKLYEDCKIYFPSIAKKSCFLSSEIGHSLKMSVLINMLNLGLRVRDDREDIETFF